MPSDSGPKSRSLVSFYDRPADCLDAIPYINFFQPSGQAGNPARTDMIIHSFGHGCLTRCYIDLVRTNQGSCRCRKYLQHECDHHINLSCWCSPCNDILRTGFEIKYTASNLQAAGCSSSIRKHETELGPDKSLLEHQPWAALTSSPPAGGLVGWLSSTHAAG